MHLLLYSKAIPEQALTIFKLMVVMAGREEEVAREERVVLARLAEEEVTGPIAHVTKAVRVTAALAGWPDKEVKAAKVETADSAGRVEGVKISPSQSQIILSEQFLLPYGEEEAAPVESRAMVAFLGRQHRVARRAVRLPTSTALHRIRQMGHKGLTARHWDMATLAMLWESLIRA